MQHTVETYQELVDSLYHVIQAMHKAAHYQIAPNDDRVGFLPFDLFDDVEAVLKQRKDVVKFIKENTWVKYDFYDKEKRPPAAGQYLIQRKDGKTHWERWNGTGWAYNGNVIVYWKQVLPILKEQASNEGF
jgi:hypothetical protein